MTDDEEVKEGKRWPSEAERANQELLDTKDTVNGVGRVSSNDTPYAVDGNETGDYVGVSPEYMTYANETEKPLRAEGGVEKDLEDEVLGQDHLVAKVEPHKGTQTQGGGSMFETVTTATSGENHSATVAKVAPDKVKVAGSPPAKKAAPARPSAPVSSST